MIDVKRYFDVIIKNGLKKFIDEHLNEKFGMNQLDKNDFIKVINDKEIIVSLNKKDLLTESQKIKLEKELQLVKTEKNITLNKISCISDQENDIMDLLNQLRDKLRNL